MPVCRGLSSSPLHPHVTVVGFVGDCVLRACLCLNVSLPYLLHINTATIHGASNTPRLSALFPDHSRAPHFLLSTTNLLVPKGVQHAEKKERLLPRVARPPPRTASPEDPRAKSPPGLQSQVRRDERATESSRDQSPAAELGRSGGRRRPDETARGHISGQPAL